MASSPSSSPPSPPRTPEKATPKKDQDKTILSLRAERSRVVESLQADHQRERDALVHAHRQELQSVQESQSEALRELREEHARQRSEWEEHSRNAQRTHEGEVNQLKQELRRANDALKSLRVKYDRIRLQLRADQQGTAAEWVKSDQSKRPSPLAKRRGSTSELLEIWRTRESQTVRPSLEGRDAGGFQRMDSDVLSERSSVHDEELVAEDELVMDTTVALTSRISELELEVDLLQREPSNKSEAPIQQSLADEQRINELESIVASLQTQDKALRVELAERESRLATLNKRMAGLRDSEAHLRRGSELHKKELRAYKEALHHAVNRKGGTFEFPRGLSLEVIGDLDDSSASDSD